MIVMLANIRVKPYIGYRESSFGCKKVAEGCNQKYGVLQTV